MTLLADKQAAMKQRIEQSAATAKERRALRCADITRAQAEALLIAQRGRCAICNKKIHLAKYTELWEEQVMLKPATACNDHDHKTGQVRGLLCANCNSGLGFFNESIEALHRAAEYLQQAIKFWNEQDN